MAESKIALFCICGAGAEGAIGGLQGAAEKFKEFWYQMHSGKGHGDCDRETAATAHARRLERDKTTKRMPRDSNYWIYPGERRPVIVHALTEKEAEAKVQKSPEYDGFGLKVYRVEEFAKLCERGEAP